MHRILRLLVISIVLALVVLGIWYILAPKNSVAPLTPAAPALVSVVPPNFVREGNLAKNNPGLRPDVWYLVYEAPSAAALTSELVFNSQSECTENGKKTLPCDTAHLMTGMRVSLEGYEQKGVVVVSALETK